MSVWVKIEPDLHALIARTAAMEGHKTTRWICRVLEAACDGRMFTSSGYCDEPEIERVPDDLKRRCEHSAVIAGVDVEEWVRRALRRRCWSKAHLDAVTDAL
jgi:predicted HicB family RNase H-like nuclease